MREILVPDLSGGIHTVQVDDCDYDRVIAAGPWYIVPHGKTFYAVRNIGGTTQTMHAFIVEGMRNENSFRYKPARKTRGCA